MCYHTTNYLSKLIFSRRGSPAVACWISDQWVAGSNPNRSMFHHQFHFIVPSACLTRFSINHVQKGGRKQHNFLFVSSFINLGHFDIHIVYISIYKYCTYIPPPPHSPLYDKPMAIVHFRINLAELKPYFQEICIKGCAFVYM